MWLKYRSIIFTRVAEGNNQRPLTMSRMRSLPTGSGYATYNLSIVFSNKHFSIKKGQSRFGGITWKKNKIFLE
jgi:hypothetical protein